MVFTHRCVRFSFWWCLRPACQTKELTTECSLYQDSSFNTVTKLEGSALSSKPCLFTHKLPIWSTCSTLFTGGMLEVCLIQHWWNAWVLSSTGGMLDDLSLIQHWWNAWVLSRTGGMLDDLSLIWHWWNARWFESYPALEECLMIWVLSSTGGMLDDLSLIQHLHNVWVLSSTGGMFGNLSLIQHWRNAWWFDSYPAFNWVLFFVWLKRDLKKGVAFVW